MKEHRKRCGLTLKELGTRVGASESYMCAIEKGERRPSPELAQKIGSVLGLDWTLFYAATAQEPASASEGV